MAWNFQHRPTEKNCLTLSRDGRVEPRAKLDCIVVNVETWLILGVVEPRKNNYALLWEFRAWQIDEIFMYLCHLLKNFHLRFVIVIFRSVSTYKEWKDKKKTIELWLKSYLHCPSLVSQTLIWETALKQKLILILETRKDFGKYSF